MSQIRSLYRSLFRCSADIYVSKLRFAVVWLGQIQNLDTGHVYVLGLKSGSERLLGFSAADSDSSRRLAQLKYEVSDTSWSIHQSLRVTSMDQGRHLFFAWWYLLNGLTVTNLQSSVNACQSVTSIWRHCDLRVLAQEKVFRGSARTQKRTSCDIYAVQFDSSLRLLSLDLPF